MIINPKISDDISESDYFEENNGMQRILKQESKQKLVDFFSNVQQNPIYTELPDFNIKKISSGSFEYLIMGTEDFLNNLPICIEFARSLAKEKEEKQYIF